MDWEGYIYIFRSVYMCVYTTEKKKAWIWDKEGGIWEGLEEKGGKEGKIPNIRVITAECGNESL